MGYSTEKADPQLDTSRVENAIAAAVDNVLDKRDVSLLERVTTKISALAETRSEDVVPITRDENTRVQVRTNSNYTSLYRSLSEPLREWRNPDSDFWMAEWFRGKATGDAHLKARAKAELDILFPLQRATLDEGAIDAGGGISAGTGAELLPHPLAQVVMTERDAFAKIRRFAMPLQMTAQTLQVPTFGAVTAAMVAEGATATQGEPDPGFVLFRANKMQAKAVSTIELLRDTPYNLVSLLGQRAGAAMGALEDVQVATSNGTAPNITQSIIAGSTQETVPGTATELTYSDIVNLYFTVPQQYRQQGIWLANSVTLAGVSGMLDTNGRPIMSSMISAPMVVVDDPGAEGFIFAKPVYEFPLGDGELVFGNLGHGYAWASRQGIEASASDAPGFETDTIMWKFTERIDGAAVDSGSMFYYTGILTYA